MADQNEEQTPDEKKWLEVALSRFSLAETYWTPKYKEQEEDLEFAQGDQWPEEIKKARQAEGRPCIVVNKIPQFIQQITNDERQSNPSIKIHPADDKADPETAKVIQGIVKNIEYNSNANVAYSNAFRRKTKKGLGFYRILTQYVSTDSFQQELLIKKIENDFGVYMDPASTEPDGSDMNWCFIFENVPHVDYKEEYENTELAKESDWKALMNRHPEGWVSEKTCRIAEYFYKDFTEVELVLLSNGQTVKASDLKKLPKGIKEVRRRKDKECVIKWVKMNALEGIEETIWPGKWIPLIADYGDVENIDGKREINGIVRNSKDSQRMSNYWKSTITETITLAPKAPHYVAQGSIPKEHRKIWDTANSKNWPYLPWIAYDEQGRPLPPPNRNSFEPPVVAMTQAEMIASDDMKSTMGIHDASLGMQGNEISGKAINARKLQSQIGNFHYIDNANISRRHCGRQLVDLIPKIYDVEQAVRITGEDGITQEIVWVNREYERNGKKVKYDLGIGKYDVIVETGPSYATRREEAAASLMDFAKALPEHASAIGDLIAKFSDWPGASELANRLKKLVPAHLLDEKSSPLPPEAQQQLSQQSQLIDQLVTKLEELQKAHDTKKVELESKERIEMAKIDANLAIEQLKLQGSIGIEAFAAEVAQINKRLEVLGMNSDQNQFDSEPVGGGDVVPGEDQRFIPPGGATPEIPMEQT